MKHEETLQTLREVKSSYVLKNHRVQLPTHYFQWLVDQAEKSADYEETIQRMGVMVNRVIDEK